MLSAQPIDVQIALEQYETNRQEKERLWNMAKDKFIAKHGCNKWMENIKQFHKIANKIDEPLTRSI